MAQPWVKRSSLGLCSRYLALNSDAPSAWMLSSNELSPEELFLIQLRDAYTSPLAITLRALAKMTRVQFLFNIPWLAPLITEVMLVDNSTIRTCAKEIYDNHVLPLLLEAHSSSLGSGIERSVPKYSSVPSPSSVPVPVPATSTSTSTAPSHSDGESLLGNVVGSTDVVENTGGKEGTKTAEGTDATSADASQSRSSSGKGKGKGKNKSGK